MANMIEIKNPNEIDINKIAKLIKNDQNNKIKRNNFSFAKIKAILNEYFMRDALKYVTANVDNELVGFLIIYPTGFASKEINPGRTLGGLPIIKKNADMEIIENKLISETIHWALDEKVKSIEMKILWDINYNQSFYEDCILNYVHFGFKVKLKYVEMHCKLADHTFKDIKIPKNINIINISEFKEQDVYNLYYKTFKNGDAKFFKYQGEEEKLVYFQELGFPDNLNKRASIALVQNHKLVAFSFVIPDGYNNHISCMCVDPESQGKGFGKLLLFIIMKKLKEQGVESITLGTEVDMKAFNLYHNHGFSITEGFIIFRWQNPN